MAQQQVQIFERKLKEFKTQVDEVAEEFAANDEGDLELGDVQPFLIDAFKAMKLEMEGANQMAKFEMSSFLKEFVDFFKQSKNLKSNTALVLPLDIIFYFTTFLKKNQARIVLIDLVQTQKQAKPATKPAQKATEKPVPSSTGALA